MDIWYFETSAVNFFMDDLSVNDALATRHLQLNKGRDWRISPVTLWEILMTSEDDRREEIISFCQHLFSRELLPSPPELIVDYIRQGMPISEQFRELRSNSSVAEVWREVVDDRSKTINIDHEDLKKRTKAIQSFTKNVHNLVKSGDFVISSNEIFSGLDWSLSSLVNELPFIKAGEPTSSEQNIRYKVALYYIMFLLCAEFDIDNKPIKEFWADVGVDSTLERIFYVIKNLPTLVHRGPFALMSIMTISQASGKYPRGVWFDSLHSVYMTYADIVFTTDGHFQGLREAIPEPLLRDKICHLGEVELTHHNVDQFGVSHD